MCGKTLTELAFPQGAAAMMVVRGEQLVAPKGQTELRVGDYVSVFCKPEDRERMQQIFGTDSSEAD